MRRPRISPTAPGASMRCARPTTPKAAALRRRRLAREEQVARMLA
jgi:hypothetical protein